MADNLEQVRGKLATMFDSVSEKDGVFTARRAYPYPNRLQAISELKMRLANVYPQADVVMSGSVNVSHGGRVLYWYITFKL